MTSHYLLLKCASDVGAKLIPSHSANVKHLSNVRTVAVILTTLWYVHNNFSIAATVAMLAIILPHALAVSLELQHTYHNRTSCTSSTISTNIKLKSEKGNYQQTQHRRKSNIRALQTQHLFQTVQWDFSQKINIIHYHFSYVRSWNTTKSKLRKYSQDYIPWWIQCLILWRLVMAAMASGWVTVSVIAVRRLAYILPQSIKGWRFKQSLPSDRN